MAHAASKSAAGPALDRKIRSSIRGIMGWEPKEYTAFLCSMPPSERRLFLTPYGNLCAKMQAQYGQWSSNLMLEWDGSEEKSNLLAAYSQQEASAQLQEIAQLRLAFLDGLYDNVPASEKEVFGELLSPAYLISGCMPDIKAAYVLYKLQDIFQMQQYHYRDLEDLAVVLRRRHPDSLSLAPLFASVHVERFMRQAMPIASSSEDSLFARLLLNACANRFCLEMAELNRLAKQAQGSMKRLVEHLQGVFGRSLPKVCGEAEVKAQVLKAMANPGAEEWRPFKGNAIEQVMARAKALAEPEHKFNASPLMYSYKWHYVLLTSLAVAWSYCTGDKHDSRLVGEGHRKHDVISGRAVEPERSYAPNLRLYHSRQFKLLWNSGQMYELDPRRIDMEHGETQCLRDSLTKFACMMKKATLAQWAFLDAALTAELKGSAWDAQPNLVDISDQLREPTVIGATIGGQP